jgi:hypothetical protein
MYACTQNSVRIWTPRSKDQDISPPPSLPCVPQSVSPPRAQSDSDKFAGGSPRECSSSKAEDGFCTAGGGHQHAANVDLVIDIGPHAGKHVLVLVALGEFPVRVVFSDVRLAEIRIRYCGEKGFKGGTTSQHAVALLQYQRFAREGGREGGREGEVAFAPNRKYLMA